MSFDEVRIKTADGVEMAVPDFLRMIEQQLADAQAKIARQEEEIRILAAQRQDKQAQLHEAEQQIERLQARDEEWAKSQAEAVTRYAEARALLEVIGNDQEIGTADQIGDSSCFYCGGDEGALISTYPFLHEYEHTPDCTWVKIRAFLQKLKG